MGNISTRCSNVNITFFIIIIFIIWFNFDSLFLKKNYFPLKNWILNFLPSQNLSSHNSHNWFPTQSWIPIISLPREIVVPLFLLFHEKEYLFFLYIRKLPEISITLSHLSLFKIKLFPNKFLFFQLEKQWWDLLWFYQNQESKPYTSES